MTKSGKYKLSLLQFVLFIVLLLGNTLFWIWAGQGTLGWKTGIAELSFAILLFTCSYLEKGITKSLVGASGLYVLFIAIINFWAP